MRLLEKYSPKHVTLASKKCPMYKYNIVKSISYTSFDLTVIIVDFICKLSYTNPVKWNKKMDAQSIKNEFNEKSSKLLGYINPADFRTRDRALFRALRSSTALTSRFLLEIDFGTFPPKGLNIPAAANDNNKNFLAIKSTHENDGIDIGEKIFSLLATSGYVNDPVFDPKSGLARPSPRVMYINPLISSPASAAMSGFIAYSLTNMSFLLAAINPALAAVPFALFAMTSLSSLRGALVTSIVEKAYNSQLDTVAHEHVHILQKDDMESGKSGFNLCANKFKSELEESLQKRAPLRHKLDVILSGNTVPNFLQDAETQARIHGVIAHECRKHGRMPTTRHELWAALIDAGLKAPEKVYKELENSPDRSHGDFYKPSLRTTFNRAARGALDKTTAELNTIYRAHLLPDLKEKFWQETLPYLYGHLLELYGHETGRKDMGFAASAKSDFTPSQPKI